MFKKQKRHRFPFSLSLSLCVCSKASLKTNKLVSFLLFSPLSLSLLLASCHPSRFSDVTLVAVLLAFIDCNSCEILLSVPPVCQSPEAVDTSTTAIGLYYTVFFSTFHKAQPLKAAMCLYNRYTYAHDSPAASHSSSYATFFSLYFLNECSPGLNSGGLTAFHFCLAGRAGAHPI